MHNFLNQVIKNKKKEIAASKNSLPLQEIIKNLQKPSQVRVFAKAISKPGRINLIAEIKKASPSAGLIRKGFDHRKIARAYQVSKVNAISVLTEKSFFKGELSFIKDIKKITRIPVLRKDFIIDEYQIFESRLYGADAVLLIAGILSKLKLKKFIKLTRALGMDSLVEVGSRADLKKALKAGADIIGINNRNLKHFKIDISLTAKLKKYIPKNKIVVAESGIKTNKTIEFLSSAGVDAVLIGEAFMRAEDIKNEIKKIMGW